MIFLWQNSELIFQDSSDVSLIEDQLKNIESLRNFNSRYVFLFTDMVLSTKTELTDKSLFEKKFGGSISIQSKSYRPPHHPSTITHRPSSFILHLLHLHPSPFAPPLHPSPPSRYPFALLLILPSYNLHPRRPSIFSDLFPFFRRVGVTTLSTVRCGCFVPGHSPLRLNKGKSWNKIPGKPARGKKLKKTVFRNS